MKPSHPCRTCCW